MTDRETAAAGLRRWASGCDAEEAAVELTIRALDGRFADPRRPWVRPCDREGWFWLDADVLAECAGALSGGEQRLLAVVEALLTAGPLWDVGGLLAGLDRPHLAVVLAALAHAGGSHDHAEPLVAWPETSGMAA